EADGLTLSGREDDVARAIRQAHTDDLVALLELDGDQSRRPRRRVLHQVGLLDEAAAGGEDEVAAFLELTHRQERRELLLGLQAQQVGDRTAAGGATGLR